MRLERRESAAVVAHPLIRHQMDGIAAPYQRLVNRGKLDDMPFTECAYEHDGKQWRQIFYAVPLDDAQTVVVRAQASETHADVLFQAAQAAAATLVPLR